MYNLGFNNAGGRVGPPFLATLLANLVPAHAKRAEVTETITVLRNQENTTAVATSMDSSNSSMLMSAGMVMTSSCFPFCNATGGIVAPALPSSSGSESTTAAASASGSGSAAPSATGAAASKGGYCGGWGFLVGGGVLAGLIG